MSPPVFCVGYPSEESEAFRGDIETTRRIKDALGMIDVTLLDRVIVTPTAALSFREKGFFDRRRILGPIAAARPVPSAALLQRTKGIGRAMAVPPEPSRSSACRRAPNV